MRGVVNAHTTTPTPWAWAHFVAQAPVNVQRTDIETCSHCGNELDDSASRRRFCAAICRRAYYAALPKGEKVPPKPRTSVHAKPCELCGKSFTPLHSRKQTCSPECSKALRGQNISQALKDKKCAT